MYLCHAVGYSVHHILEVYKIQILFFVIKGQPYFSWFQNDRQKQDFSNFLPLHNVQWYPGLQQVGSLSTNTVWEHFLLAVNTITKLSVRAWKFTTVMSSCHIRTYILRSLSWSFREIILWNKTHCWIRAIKLYYESMYYFN